MTMLETVKAGGYITVEQIQKAVIEFIDTERNGCWPQDTWFYICDNKYVLNIYMHNDDKCIAIYQDGDNSQVISIPVLENKRGSAIMEKADPGEPTTTGHDSKVGNVSLIPLSETVNRTDVEQLIKIIVAQADDGNTYDVGDNLFKNIIFNAIHSQYGVRYWSQVLKSDTEKGYLRIRVVETGGGFDGRYVITSEALEKHFARILVNPDIIAMKMNLADLDAEDCESIIQVFLFGKLIFS